MAKAMHTAHGQDIASPCGFTPAGKLESEALLEQSPRDDGAALENEVGFRAHERRPNLEHPIRGWQTERHAVRVSKHAHELRVRQRVRRREVHGAVDVATGIAAGRSMCPISATVIRGRRAATHAGAASAA